MKVTKCDTCKKDDAKTYQYTTGKHMDPSGNGYELDFKYIDLCLNCLQDFVLKHQIKLTEVSGTSSNNKGIIYG